MRCAGLEPTAESSPPTPKTSFEATSNSDGPVTAGGSGVGRLALTVRHRQQFLGVSLAELGLFQAAQHPG
jgi:hypothetical protein